MDENLDIRYPRNLSDAECDCEHAALRPAHMATYIYVYAPRTSGIYLPEISFGGKARTSASVIGVTPRG